MLWMTFMHNQSAAGFAGLVRLASRLRTLAPAALRRPARVNSSGYRGRMDHPDQVAGYVARTALGEATAPVPLAAGAWSTAYALTIAGRAMVLRVSRYGGDFAKDEAVSAVVGGTLPVPRSRPAARPTDGRTPCRSG